MLSQQPPLQEVALQELDPPPLVLPLLVLPPVLLLPPLALDPLVLLVLPPPLVELPLLVELPPLLLPPLLPLPPVELKLPESRESDAFPGPPVAHANASPPTDNKTIPRAANRPRKCILSVYLSALPLQGAGPRLGSSRPPRDTSKIR